MDDDSGESTVEDEVAGVGRDESEWEWFARLRCVYIINEISIAQIRLKKSIKCAYLLNVLLAYHKNSYTHL